jgi:GTP cyclohydrolase FolE2
VAAASTGKPDIVVRTQRGDIPITHAGVTWLLRACLLENLEGLSRTREAFATAAFVVDLPQAEVDRFRRRLAESLDEYTREQQESPGLTELEQLRKAL